MEQGKILEEPVILIEAFVKKGLQKVEIWKEKSSGKYFAVPLNGKPPENSSFIGMTKIQIN